MTDATKQADELTALIILAEDRFRSEYLIAPASVPLKFNGITEGLTLQWCKKKGGYALYVLDESAGPSATVLAVQCSLGIRAAVARAIPSLHAAAKAALAVLSEDLEAASAELARFLDVPTEAP
jgi:hypothetical protein